MNVPRTRQVIGCMTGSSIDGLDVSLVEVVGSGLTLGATLRRSASRTLGGLAPRLRSLANQDPWTAGDIAQLSHDFSQFHTDFIGEFLNGRKVDLVVVHGQTVFHAPPISWQLIQPAIIAFGLRTPVVFDMRAADLAAGGNGAPITPLADWVFFRHERETRSIVNLGGFCNITHLPHSGSATPASAQLSGIAGYDVCVCNQLLDAIARRTLGMPIDEDGARASTGRIHEGAFRDLRIRLDDQASGNRSLGTGDEHMAWVDRYANQVDGESLSRTACEALGETIARRTQGADRILVAGGGINNACLVRAIATHAHVPVETTAAYDVPPTYREAAEMAVLGALCEDGTPITLPAVTRVPEPVICGARTHVG